MSSITAGTTSTTTLVHSGDTTGSLVFKTNDTGSGGTTAVTLDTSQNATFAGKVTSAGALTLASNGTTTAVTIDTSQNVGIGTTSTSAKLSVSLGGVSTLGQQSNQALALLGGGSNNQLCQIGMGYGTGTTYTPTAIGSITTTQTGNTIADLIFATRNVNTDTAPSERMRIDSSGNLLVGTTSQTPGYGNTNTGVQLSNNGSHFSRGATDWVMTVNQNTADGSARYLIGFRVSNSQVGNIQSNGTNCTYNSNSDYRLKENVRPMQNALGKVARLNPVTYKWKLDGSDGEGFIAHELAEVVPECVTGEKDAVDADGNPVYQGIDTSFLVATLTAAIQEQQALINALTARVVALESK